MRKTLRKSLLTTIGAILLAVLAAFFVACGKKAEQGILHTILGQYVTESVNGIMHEAHRLYFLYFALLAESFLDILQVCSASGEYDSGE